MRGEIKLCVGICVTLKTGDCVRLMRMFEEKTSVNYYEILLWHLYEGLLCMTDILDMGLNQCRVYMDQVSCRLFEEAVIDEPISHSCIEQLRGR